MRGVYISRGHALRCGLIVACILCLLVTFTGCYKKEKSRYADLLGEFDEDDYADREASEEKIRDLEKKIEELRKDVERTISDRYDLALYYKMLAVEYIELGMYGPAGESLEKAIAISPGNRVLFYYAGVCAAQLSKSTPVEAARNEYLWNAEFYYKRAIELKNDYVDALFGLAVLYVFEMNRPLDAMGLLENVLRYSSGNTQAMFLMARVYVQLGDIEAAVDMYDTIMATSPFDEEKKEAEDNKRSLLEEYYGT